MEIQRHRAWLRAAVDLKTLGEFTITRLRRLFRLTVHVLHQLPAPVALADALNKLVAAGVEKTKPMKGMVAAVSVGYR